MGTLASRTKKVEVAYNVPSSNQLQRKDEIAAGSQQSITKADGSKMIASPNMKDTDIKGSSHSGRSLMSIFTWSL